MHGLFAISVYSAFIKMGFIRQAKFRLANIAGLFTNTFFMIFRAAIFQALFANAALIAGCNLDYMLTYAVMVQVLIMVIPQWGSVGLSEDIRTGQIAVDLMRPINYYLMVLSKRIGISAFYLLARGIPALLIGIFLGFFRLVPDLYHIALEMISLVLSIWLASSIHFLIELCAFWLESSQGPKRLVMVASYFLSGAFIPTALFPPWAQEINLFLPFQYTINSTIEILMGASQPLKLLGFQFLWVVVISVFCLLGLNRGQYKVALHGG